VAARLTAFIVVGIVAATLIAGLIVGAQRDDNSGPVDLIVFNGRVHLPEGHRAEAVAVRGNRILRVGSNREIKRLRRPQTLWIDAHGGSVLPGFNDAHVRLLDGGLALEQADLTGAATPDDVRRVVGDFAAAHPDRPWVLGRNLSDIALPSGVSARELLDAAVPDRPVRLADRRGRASWVNSRALALAGITRRTARRTGAIGKHPRTGEPTGIVRDAAQQLIERALPPVDADDRRRALRAAVAEAHRVGVTSVHDVGADPEALALYEDARQTGDLNVRVYAAVPVAHALTPTQTAWLDGVRARYPDDPLFKAGAVTVAADETGLHRLLPALDAQGWQVMVDAGDEMAVSRTLDAFERAAGGNGPQPRGRRHRIESGVAADPADVLRFGPLGIIASARPAGTADPDPLYVGVSTHGGRLAFGSGWPDAPLDPREGLLDALAPAPAAPAPVDDAASDEAADAAPAGLPLDAALDAYTHGSAYASFDELRKGSVEAGMLADLVILSTDLSALPPARLLDAAVDMTIFDGKVVHAR
jgi:predicted amidohydrolase YtcJ